MTKNLELPLIARARSHGDRKAIIATEGTFTYEQLLEASASVASCLLADAGDLAESRVAFLVAPGFQYVATQWGIWRAGGIAVPLAVSHPPRELEYVIDDAASTVILAHPDFVSTLRPVADTRKIRFLTTGDALTAHATELPEIAESRPAMMVYTSGTTGKPRGVVTTHTNIRAQVTTLVPAWEWSANDHILLALPLHHTHGIINVLTCALWAGAVCDMLPRFDTETVWSRIVDGNLTLFMAVPTMYRKLIAAWDRASPERRGTMSDACARLRLMVSGSAALPVQTLERWREVSGQTLLERYGTTESGMALSNPLHGERVPGSVGTPLPGVEVRLVDDDGKVVEVGTPGEIQVKGPGVFRDYWRRPEATVQAFRDEWFVTGDIAVVEGGIYRILGRKSVDIIKTGGYKVSALEIEEVLRAHPDIRECAVVGVDDPEWGERVCVAVELQGSSDLTIDSLRYWAKDRLAPYKVPRTIRSVRTLPRNDLGKVRKPEVAALFTGSGRG